MPGPLLKVLDFCRAGYPPTGVPAHGYVPLIALYGRRDADAAISSTAPARRRG
ncbi:DUF3349 domain-containing protein [Mycobacterium sp. 4D054]|uniref:DUF3349 domain-containing protein n=1 Tax=unclassified Mycobacterium TaxID=2642494 RepID=UPI0021B16384|nr:DUF3349 domain-containing protein [Mycobacterium sp. SMC-8]UXA14409.1 DUF3349 domain-containing protein [Mycobacterium sp. SMC-8]